MRSRQTPSRVEVALMCAFAGLAVLTCAALFTAAALVPAPPAVLPLVVVVCIAAPMAAAWELRGALSSFRRAYRDADVDQPLDSSTLSALRRHLAQLPETQHPLGL